MCGIAGVFQNSGKIENLEQVVLKMNDFQNRRGPDDSGLFVDEKKRIIFGHRRLSILDLSSAGHQPMTRQIASGKGQIAITFNGEIYNFLELRKGLEAKGCKFKTKTDTEVILALYDKYGEKAFEMLRGMFAFALWDEKNRKAFLVKDRYGIKPLYYYSDNEKLVFASTVRAIKESNLISVEKNEKAAIGFLLFGSVPLPMTTLKNVLAVPNGHYLERDLDGRQKIVKYYNPLDAFSEKLHYTDDSQDNAINEIRKLLEESIGLHLISDAPLGVFLSGGLDSSAIAALAAKNRKKPISTLSIVFDEPEFSEQKYQKMAAEKIGSDHREIKIAKQDFYDLFDEIFEAMDQPTIDGINTFFISKAAKEAGLKVVLSGLGADEIFYGYSSFKKAELIRKIQGCPEIFKSPLKIFSLLGDRYSKLNYFTKDDFLSFYLGIRGLFAPKEVAKILNVDKKEVENVINEILLQQLADKELSGLNAADLLSYLEIKFYLQNQLLKDTDFMSMHHSIEVRVPFLDHKLVEYLSRLESGLKFSEKENKPLLVGAVRDLLPMEIFSRSKMGFTFPFQQWLGEHKGIKAQEQKSIKTHWSRFWAKEVLLRFIK